jgi:hypothetical protein
VQGKSQVKMPKEGKMKKFLMVIVVLVALAMVPMNGAMAQDVKGNEEQATFSMKMGTKQGFIQGKVSVELMYKGPKKLGAVLVVLDYNPEQLHYAGGRHTSLSRTKVVLGGISPDDNSRSTIKFMTMLSDGLTELSNGRIDERVGTLDFLPKSYLLRFDYTYLKVQELQVLDTDGNIIPVSYEPLVDAKYTPPCLKPFEDALYADQEQVSLFAEAYICYRQVYASIRKLSG